MLIAVGVAVDMNFSQLKRNVGYRVQLVPVACHLDEFGLLLPERDEDWIIHQVTNEHILVEAETGHRVHLGTDHIHHFTTNPQRSQGTTKFGFLSLHVQIFIQGVNVRLKPTLRPGESMPPPEVRIHDKSVGIDYPTNSGIQQRLEASGFKLHWCLESNVSRRTILEGWEILYVPNNSGELFRFRVNDRADDLILLRKRM